MTVKRSNPFAVGAIEYFPAFVTPVVLLQGKEKTRGWRLRKISGWLFIGIQYFFFTFSICDNMQKVDNVTYYSCSVKRKVRRVFLLKPYKKFIRKFFIILCEIIKVNNM
jgi:hypothetical protein